MANDYAQQLMNFDASMERLAEERRQFDEQMNKLWLPTLNDINRPNAVSGLSGMLMNRPDLYGALANLPTFGSLSGLAGLFGYVGNDPRFQGMGYEAGAETLGGRQQGSNEARSDTEMSMEYGGTIIGGKPAPPWMAPHAAWAQEFARTHQGRAPTQEELTAGISGAVNSALGTLRSNPEYMAADGARRRQMESQAVAGATGMTPQNASSMVMDLRQASADAGGRPSTAQEIVDSVARWTNPDDPALAVNLAMTRLRADPAYQALDGAGRQQREAQAISKVTGMPLENAARAVQEFRSGTSVSGGLSGNDLVNRVIQRNMPAGATLSTTGQQGGALYGQAGAGGPTATSGFAATAGPQLQIQLARDAQGGQRFTPEQDARYQADVQQWVQGARAAGKSEEYIQQTIAQDARHRAEGTGTMQFNQQAGPTFGSAGAAPMAGINFAGSNAPAQNTAAMSPAQRALYEQSRQADVQAQLNLRQQDIARETSLMRDALDRGQLDLAKQHEANLVRLQTGEMLGRLDGQDTLAREGQEADIALRASAQAAQMRTDPFALEMYRRGLDSSGVPNIIRQVGGRGQLPASSPGAAGAPAAMSLQNAVTPVTGRPGVPQGVPQGATQPGMRSALGGPSFGSMGGAAPIASLEDQASALGPLRKIRAKSYYGADPSGRNYVNSAYKFAGEAADDADVADAAEKALPRFARKGVPTFGRLAAAA